MATSYRNSLLTIIKTICPSAFSEIAPNQPSLPYCVIQEEDGTRDGTTSGPFVTYLVRVEIYTANRASGEEMRDDIMDTLDSASGDFWFVVRPSGVDVDSDSETFIHSVEVTITPK